MDTIITKPDGTVVVSSSQPPIERTKEQIEQELSFFTSEIQLIQGKLEEYQAKKVELENRLKLFK